MTESYKPGQKILDSLLNLDHEAVRSVKPKSLELKENHCHQQVNQVIRGFK